MRHIVSQTVVIQKNYMKRHLFVTIFFLFFSIISLTTMKTRPFTTGIVVTIPTAQHLSERNAKARIILATGF